MNAALYMMSFHRIHLEREKFLDNTVLQARRWITMINALAAGDSARRQPARRAAVTARMTQPHGQAGETQ